MAGDEAVQEQAGPGAPPPDPPAPRRDSIGRNTAFGAATNLTTAAFTAALTLYLVRALGPDEYGVFALAVGISTLLVLVSDFGMTGSSGRFVAERRDRLHEVAGITWDAVRLKLAFSAPVCILLVVLAQPLANLYDNQDLVTPLRVMGLVVLGQGLFLFMRNLFTSSGTVSYTWRVTLLESAFEFVASVTLVAASSTAAAAAWGRAAGYVLGSLVAVVLAVRYLGSKSMANRTTGHMRGLTGYAGPLFIVTIAFALFEQVDVLLIGAILGTTAVGEFEAPLRLTAFLSYGGLAVAFGVAPRLARDREGPDVRTYLNSMRYLTILQAALIPPLLAWSTPIVSLLLGPDYSKSADVLLALTPFVFLSGIGTFVTLAVNYVGEARRRVWLSVGTVLINIVLDVVLLPTIGVVGGAIGTDVAFGAYALGHVWILHGAIGAPLRPVNAQIGRCLVAAGAATLALAAFGTESLAVWQWVAGGIVGAAVFMAALLATRAVTTGELSLLRTAVTSRIAAARAG